MNDLGQRTNVSMTGTQFAATPNTTWSYDSFGQVVSADHSTDNTADRGYVYDSIGNRRGIRNGAVGVPLEANGDITPGQGTLEYATNALNQYTSVPSVPLVPAYDDDGNAEQYPLPADLTANSILAWDGENRLISITVSSDTTNYRYDSGGRRIATIPPTGAATLTIYDGWNPIANYTGSVGVTPTLAKTNLWGMDLSGSMQGAGGVGGLLLITTGAQRTYTANKIKPAVKSLGTSKHLPHLRRERKRQ